MKARQSPLAKQVLADPKAREQLREFLSRRDPATVIELRTQDGRQLRLRPMIVPKAA